MTATAHPTGRAPRPVLITDAGMSRQDEYKLRRRRYDLLMLGRLVCVVAAFVVGSVFSNILLAGIFIAGAAVLPWAAVLIANDRLPTAAAARRAHATPSPSGAVPIAAADAGASSGHPVIES